MNSSVVHHVLTGPRAEKHLLMSFLSPLYVDTRPMATQMQNQMYDVLSEVQSCRGELDTHIHSLEKHVEELREGFRSLMPLLSSTLSTQNSSIRHLLREREVKTETASAGVDR